MLAGVEEPFDVTAGTVQSPGGVLLHLRPRLHQQRGHFDTHVFQSGGVLALGEVLLQRGPGAEVQSGATFASYALGARGHHGRGGHPQVFHHAGVEAALEIVGDGGIAVIERSGGLASGALTASGK